MRRRKVTKKLSEEAKPKTKKVRFNLFAPEAERAFLAGNFNNWDVDNHPRKKGKNRGSKQVPTESILSTSKGHHPDYAKGSASFIFLSNSERSLIKLSKCLIDN
jgi:hypothetical protein